MESLIKCFRKMANILYLNLLDAGFSVHNIKNLIMIVKKTSHFDMYRLRFQRKKLTIFKTLLLK